MIRQGELRYLKGQPITIINFVNGGPGGEQIQFVFGHVDIHTASWSHFLTDKCSDDEQDCRG